MFFRFVLMAFFICQNSFADYFTCTKTINSIKSFDDMCDNSECKEIKNLITQKKYQKSIDLLSKMIIKYEAIKTNDNCNEAKKLYLLFWAYISHFEANVSINKFKIAINDIDKASKIIEKFIEIMHNKSRTNSMNFHIYYLQGRVRMCYFDISRFYFEESDFINSLLYVNKVINCTDKFECLKDSGSENDDFLLSSYLLRSKININLNKDKDDFSDIYMKLSSKDTYFKNRLLEKHNAFRVAIQINDITEEAWKQYDIQNYNKSISLSKKAQILNNDENVMNSVMMIKKQFNYEIAGLLSSAYYYLSDYDNALENINKAIDNITNNKTYHIFQNRSEIYIQKKQYKEALVDLEEAYDICDKTNCKDKEILMNKKNIILKMLKN